MCACLVLLAVAKVYYYNILMSINNSPEADIYVPMTREEAASNNYIMNTDQTNNTNNQNDDEIEQSNSGSNMISNVLNEVNTFIDSLEDSPPLFAAPPPTTTDAQFVDTRHLLTQHPVT